MYHLMHFVIFFPMFTDFFHHSVKFMQRIQVEALQKNTDGVKATAFP